MARMRPRPEPEPRLRRIVVVSASIGMLVLAVDAAADFASTPTMGGAAPLAYSLDGSVGASGWQVTPTVGLGLTWSDNLGSML